MSDRQVFRGESEAQAIIAMKTALGFDALMIEKPRRVKCGGFLGFGGREIVEVVGERCPEWLRNVQRAQTKKTALPMKPAGPDPIARTIRTAQEVVRRRAAESEWIVDGPLAVDASPSPGELAGIYTPLAKKAAPRPRRPAASSAPEALIREAAPKRDELGFIRRELDELKKEIRSMARIRPAVEAVDELPEALRAFRDRFVEAGLPSGMAGDLVDRVVKRSKPAEWEDEAVMKSRLAKEVERTLKVAPPLEPDPDVPTVIALVGPTGVGKTTTLAKLGSILVEEEARRVAFISLDFYRIGGTEQLRTYSEILGVAFEEAATAEDLKEILARHLDKEFILVDTTGRSPYHAEGIDEVRDLFRTSGAEPRLFVVVSANTDYPEMERAIRNFRIAEDVSLVFTKLDETRRWGQVLAASCATQIPVAYMTTGQNVPHDIEPARPSRLADRLLEAPPAEAIAPESAA